MADLSTVTQYLPSKSSLISFGGTTFHILTIFFIVLIFMIIGGIIVYLFIRNLKFRYKIIIFGKVGNHWEQIGKDRAMELKYGIAGDSIFYLRKKKKYLPRPELQQGRNIFWFGIREDQEWINISLEDIDFAMRKARAKFLHPEMRYARTALLRNLKDRYDKPKFLEKYGVMLVNLAAIVIILVFMWLIIDKIITVGDKVNSMVDTSGKVMDKAQQVLASLDNICTGGSGVRRV